jgi:hypothetical protein
LLASQDHAKRIILHDLVASALHDWVCQVTVITKGRSAAAPVHWAHALFVFHLALFTWWAFSLVYFHVVRRLILPSVDPTLPFGVISLTFIVMALVVTTHFALNRRGTAAQNLAWVAVALAAIDMLGETLQFGPQLGLPALVPSGKDMTELWVRGIWASCEFAMRSAVFVALWRSQTGAERRMRSLFFGLVGVHWVLAMISFARDTEPYAAWWSTQAGVRILIRLSPLIGLAWMGLLVWLSRRVAYGHDLAPAE